MPVDAAEPVEEALMDVPVVAVVLVEPPVAAEAADVPEVEGAAPEDEGQLTAAGRLVTPADLHKL